MKENHSTVKHSGSGQGAPKGSTLHLEGVRGIDQSAGYQRFPAAPAATTLPSCLTACLVYSPVESVSGEPECKTSKHFRTFCLEWGLKPRSLFMYWFLTQQHRVLCVCPSSPFSYFHLFLKESERNGLILT